MVCLGNICRSPLAEGILRAKIKERKLDWEVDSAGTGGWHAGQAPDSRSIKVARNRGVDLSLLKARQVKPSDLEYYDLILVMDKSNLSNMLQIPGAHKNIDKIKLVSLFSNKFQNHEVPDPYYDTEKEFHQVYDMLEDAIDGIINEYY